MPIRNRAFLKTLKKFGVSDSCFKKGNEFNDWFRLELYGLSDDMDLPGIKILLS
jgi:hypothetical protein